MTRGVVTAVAVGALLFAGAAIGMDVYFRAVSWRETRRSIKESA